MHRYPKISIVTVCYNSEKTIERTILSVKKQSYPNLEYIIVDGGSTDKTVQIITSYLGDVVTKYLSEPDNGISDAFNKGIKMATGEIIGLINSDDGYLENALTYVAQAYTPQADIYRGNIIFWDEDNDKRIREKPSHHISYSGIGLKLCHQGTFVTKRAYDEYGMFDIALRYNMDYDLLLRYQRRGLISTYINQDIAFFTMNGVTFSGQKKKQKEEMISIIKKNGGNSFDVFAYKVVNRCKMTAKKIIGVDRILYLKNRKDN